MQDAPIAAPPNIVLILTDDQGIGQAPCFADGLSVDDLIATPTPRYRCAPGRALAAARDAMPALGAIANDGVVCTDAHVSSPVCGPSRCALMTGRYNQRFGVYGNADANQGLPTTETCLAAPLQAAGYETAVIGKWHLGKRTWQKVDSDSRDYHRTATVGCIPEHHPLARGFDYYFGFNSTGTSYYDSPSLFRNRTRVRAEGFLTDQLSEEAVAFVKRAQRPFFLYLPYSAPHIPLEDRAPEHYSNRFDTGNAEADNYYGHLAAVDDGIGRIVSALKAKGQYENTLVFFLSDNGGVVDSPQPLNGPFIGFKGRQRQGGCRTPLIVSWPCRFPARTRCEALLSSLDVMPTALRAAGLSLPEDLDGIDLVPVLTGEQDAADRTLVWAGPDSFHWSEENGAFWTQYWTWITEGSDDPAEKTPAGEAAPPAWAVRHGDWFLYHRADTGDSILLRNGDTANCASANAGVVRDLTGRYHTWAEEIAKPLRWQHDAWQHLKPAHVVHQ